MVARGRGVNSWRASGDRGRPPSNRKLRHNKRNNSIRRLMHDVHDTAETFRIRCDAGERIRHPARSFGMQQNGIRFVSGPGLADRLARTGDSGRLRGPVFPALSFRLQRVVAWGNSARFADEPIFVGAELPKVSLLPVDIHGPRRTAVIGIIPLDDHADPTIFGTFRLLAGIPRQRTGRLPTTVLEQTHPSTAPGQHAIDYPNPRQEGEKIAIFVSRWFDYGRRSRPRVAHRRPGLQRIGLAGGKHFLRRAGRMKACISIPDCSIRIGATQETMALPTIFPRPTCRRGDGIAGGKPSRRDAAADLRRALRLAAALLAHQSGKPVASGENHQKLWGTSIWSPGRSSISSDGLDRTALTSIMRTSLPRSRRTLRWSA